MIFTQHLQKYRSAKKSRCDHYLFFDEFENDNTNLLYAGKRSFPIPNPLQYHSYQHVQSIISCTINLLTYLFEQANFNNQSQQHRLCFKSTSTKQDRRKYSFLPFINKLYFDENDVYILCADNYPDLLFILDDFPFEIECVLQLQYHDLSFLLVLRDHFFCFPSHP